MMPVATPRAQVPRTLTDLSWLIAGLIGKVPATRNVRGPKPSFTKRTFEA